MARLVREAMVYSVGLAPAWNDVAVPAPALGLAWALVNWSARPVGILDALGTWGCARELVAGAVRDGGPVITSWIQDGLALLTPSTQDPVVGLTRLRACVVSQSARFSHLVVDLTGFDQLGERRAAFGSVDSTALVARSGRTTFRQVHDAMAEVPEGRALGVLLTGL